MAAPGRAYEELDHTADLRIALYGETLEALFANGALALFDLLVDGESGGGGDTPWSLRVEGDDLEDLLVRWLGELLYRFEVDGCFVTAVEACRIGEPTEGGRTLEARVRGDRIEPGGVTLRNEIKAVTYHRISVRPKDSGWRAEVVFDV